MNKIIYILLLAMLLAACETQLTYNGPTEPEKLVLNCTYHQSETQPEVPCVYLTHSFFMGQHTVDTVVRRDYYYGGQGDTVWYEYTEYRPATGYVADATVEMRIGEGDWQLLHYDAEHKGYLPATWSGLTTGQHVDIRASHPTYGEVQTAQLLPHPIRGATGKYIDMDKNGLVHLQVTLPAYEGAVTDVIGIQCTGTFQQTFRRVYNGHVQSTWIDTVDVRETYSLDPVFGLLHNLQSKAGYYGAHTPYMLYLPASALTESRTIDLYADWPTGSYWGGVQMSFAPLDLQVNFYACTIDDYRYLSSLLSYQGTQLSDPHGKETDTDYDLTEIMEEVAVMLGAQEGVQLYNNITGGLGHFGISHHTRLRLIGL